MSSIHKYKHPKSLFIFFGTEMWERYGFYVLQTLLVLFLSQKFNFSDSKSFMLFGSFTALTYISPVVGGFIADKFLGQKISIVFGIVMLFLGYLILSIIETEFFLIIALSSIAIGTGLLKPNISAMLGIQYEKGSNLKDSGFTIFYMGITLGIVLGSIIPSELKQTFSWNVCFFSAALTLSFAFFYFLIGSRFFKIKEYENNFSLKSLISSLFLLVALFITCVVLLSYPDISTIFFISIMFLSVLYCIVVAISQKGLQRKKTICILILCIISVLFWMMYFQMFLSLTLFITRVVEPVIFGINFPAPFYIMMQSVGMLFFGIFLVKIWKKIKSKNLALVSGLKFLGAMFIISLAYGIILFSMKDYNSPFLVAPWLLIVAYLFISIAELLLSPVGLCAITNLSSPRTVSTMMGIFFVSLGAGGFFSGKLASLTSIHHFDTDTLMRVKQDYFYAFKTFFGITMITFLISAILIFIIYRLMKKENHN